MWASISEETQVLALNRTSGTTGRIKGVAYTYRSVVLDAVDPALIISSIAEHGMKYMCCPPGLLYMLLDQMTELAQRK